MKIAQLVPANHFEVDTNNDYHMALAHLAGNEFYASFFRKRAEAGHTVIMDNGVVETGKPMSMSALLDAARCLGATEMILPDIIGNALQTQLDGNEALRFLKEETQRSRPPRLMAVPQGSTRHEWLYCFENMLDWPVDTIGISKFTILNGVWTSRLAVIMRIWKQLKQSGKEVHLLGSPLGPAEVSEIDHELPGLVRGIDTGDCTFYAAAGRRVEAASLQRPRPEINFLDGSEISSTLLRSNYQSWRRMATL